MTALFVIVVAFAAIVSALWLIGAREPVLREKGPAWFIALRGGEGDVLAPHVLTLWSARADQVFIGGDDPYWTHFIIAVGDGTTPLANEHCDDAYVARVRLFAPPRIALGLVRVLIALGILSRPSTANVATDVQSIGFNPDHMPSASAIARLLARPGTYAPAMVNFLRYTRDGAGRADYRKYGIVAMRTVFRTGGALLFYGAVTETVRHAKAWPAGSHWHDVAAMRYPSPPAILSMEHVPAYRAALVHRDAGLERTVVIASTPT